MAIERYEHHGRIVSVDDMLKGKHREHCLCFICDRFNPNSEDNCPIAAATFANCVKFGTVTPVYECPEFLIAAG